MGNLPAQHGWDYQRINYKTILPLTKNPPASRSSSSEIWSPARRFCSHANHQWFIKKERRLERPPMVTNAHGACCRPFSSSSSSCTASSHHCCLKWDVEWTKATTWAAKGCISSWKLWPRLRSDLARSLLKGDPEKNDWSETWSTWAYHDQNVSKPSKLTRSHKLQQFNGSTGSQRTPRSIVSSNILIPLETPDWLLPGESGRHAQDHRCRVQAATSGDAATSVAKDGALVEFEYHNATCSDHSQIKWN